MLSMMPFPPCNTYRYVPMCNDIDFTIPFDSIPQDERTIVCYQGSPPSGAEIHNMIVGEGSSLGYKKRQKQTHSTRSRPWARSGYLDCSDVCCV